MSRTDKDLPWELGGQRHLDIDHDHRCCGGDKICGKCVRGLLCSACNLSIGKMQDDPNLLRKAADYLESWA